MIVVCSQQMNRGLNKLGMNDAVLLGVSIFLCVHSAFSAERNPEQIDGKVWPHFEAAVTNLNQGASRLQIAEQFERINKDFPGSRYEKQAAEYARILRMMALEDEAFKMPADIAAVSPAEQAKIALFRLRDRNATQMSEPGHCYIPSSSGFSFYGHNTKISDLYPPEPLLDLGFAAVPILIAALDDERLTRSYGLQRSWTPYRHVLRIGDGAIQMLEMIAGESFYRPTTTSSYLQSEKPELRAAVRERVEAWWTKSQAVGEVAFLRSKAAEAKAYTEKTGHATYQMNQARFLYRLTRLDGPKAVPDIRTMPSGSLKGFRSYYYRLLLLAGGEDAEKEVSDAANPDSDKFECGAALALLHTKQLNEADYRDILYQGALNVCRRTKSGQIPVHLFLLADTKDPRSMLLLSGIGRVNNRYDYFSLEVTGNVELDKKMASQIMVALHGTNQLQSVCHNLNQVLGRPLGKPEQTIFAPGWNETKESETKEILFRICAERGIKPATSLPWE